MSLDVKILGPGCAKCKTLERITNEVVIENQIDAVVTKVEDIIEIMQYSVISTPALVINNKVVIKGKLPSKEEIKKHMDEANHG